MTPVSTWKDQSVPGIIPACIGVPELIFLGGREIFARIYPRQEFVEGCHNNFGKTCPSRKRSGVPQIWLSVPFEGLINTRILILRYFPNIRFSGIKL